MKLSERLQNALTKLYTAFHNGKLNPVDCKACAVGNICDNNKDWVKVFGCGNIDVSDFENQIEQCKYYSKDFEKGMKTIRKTGYSDEELFTVECVFLNQVSDEENREQQFKGLCAVVSYLCELDGIENVMSIQSLFEYDQENKPKHELNF